MPLGDRFLPRNENVAKWVLFVLTVVASGITLIFTLLLPSTQTKSESGVTIVACSGLLAIVTALLTLKQRPAWLWASYPFLTIAMLTLLDITSQDASATAQVFFFFPVLYAGAQLRRAAAIAICAAAIAGEALVAFTVLAGPAAATDLAFVAAALCTTGALLVHAGERSDRLIAQLERHAAVDPLTGLLTRRVLDSAVASALEGAGDPAGTSLLLMDVDRFKSINDVHGHPAGDAVLQQLAGILLDMSRSSDMVSRLGGDEIAVLLVGCPLEVAAERGREILIAIRQHPFDVSAMSMAPHHEGSQPLSVTLSMGVAHLPAHAKELHGLYSAADAALYEAKRGGRDRIAVPGLAAVVGAERSPEAQPHLIAT